MPRDEIHPDVDAALDGPAVAPGGFGLSGGSRPRTLLHDRQIAEATSAHVGENKLSAEGGDLADGAVPGRVMDGVGGIVDLAAGVKRAGVTMRRQGRRARAPCPGRLTPHLGTGIRAMVSNSGGRR